MRSPLAFVRSKSRHGGDRTATIGALWLWFCWLWSCRSCLAPCTRVCCIVDLGQMLEIQMCVDLGRGDAGVAEQFLDRAQVSARLQQMAGKGVAQHVRMHVLLESACPRQSLQPPLHSAWAEPFPVPTDEQC